MDFELSEELIAVRDLAREFAEKEIAPSAAKDDREKNFRGDLVKKMGELGFYGTMIPDLYGGNGLGFLAMVLRLGEGRDLAARKKAGEHIFKALSAHLDPVFAASKFALSFDMQINDKETSWKRNNIHDALKVETAHG